MSVKNTLKQWFEAIDEALRQTSAPAVATQQSPLPIGNTDGQQDKLVSPLGTRVSPGDTVIVPTDVHVYIDSIISPNYVQINSLHMIETDLRRPFAHGCTEVTLVFVHNRLVMPATLESIHNTYLVVRMQHTVNDHKRGENLLMITPALPQKRYVLQLTVDGIFGTRLKLRYQDPRYDVRRQVRLEAPVLLCLSPPTLLPAIRQQQVRIMREITLPPEESQQATPGRLADQLYEIDTPTLSSFMQQFERTPVLTCGLQDISLGGTCLTLAGKHRSEDFLHHLILLHIPLPAFTIDSLDLKYLPVNLDLLGAVRVVRTTPPALTLRVRFLKRLPEALAPYLTELERCNV